MNQGPRWISLRKQIKGGKSRGTMSLSVLDCRAPQNRILYIQRVHWSKGQAAHMKLSIKKPQMNVSSELLRHYVF
jgi:hypothetical protein